jgi:outer membrane protein TolC
MVNKEKTVRIFWVLCLTLLILWTQPGKGLWAAEKSGLEAAVVWGLTHSPTLLSLEEEVEQIRRQLAKIETGLNWQAGLTGGISASGTDGAEAPALGRSDGKQAEVGIQGNKYFRTGLSLEPKITLKKQFSSTEEAEVAFTFRLVQQLYPWVPSSAEQEHYKTLNRLKKAEDNFNWQVTTSKIDWLEGYLNLLRLYEQLLVAETEYKIVADELSLTQVRQEIGEAGKQQILAAQVSLKQAEYRHKQTLNRFAEAKRQWFLALGLPTDYPIVFEEKSSYFRELQAEVDALKLTADRQELFSQAEAVHYQVAAKRIDRAQLEQEWKWKQKDYQPEVTTGGTYDAQSKSWTLNLNLTYQFWDGGARRLETEEYEARRKALDREEESVRANLNNQLQALLGTVELAELQLEEKKLAYEKVNNEVEVYRLKLEAGYLTEKDWTLKELERKTAELGCKSAEDQVFISKLRVLQMVGLI